MYEFIYFKLEKQTEETISAVCANENYLFIGRINGNILKFTLPHVSVEPKYFLDNKAAIMNIVLIIFLIRIVIQLDCR